MYCKNCGAELKEGQKFCMKCGTPVDGAVTDTAKSDANTPAAANEPSGKNNQTLIIAAVIVVVIIVIIVAIVSRCSNSDDQAEEEETLQEDVEGSYEEDTGTFPETEVEVAPTLEDGITVSDATIKEFTCYDNWGTTGLVASGTIQNDNDIACTVTLDFEFEGTNHDNYGDEQTTLDYTSCSFNVAAHSTTPVYSVLLKDKDSDYDAGHDAGAVARLYEHVSYTGGLDTTVKAYEGDEKLLPPDEVSKISCSADNGVHVKGEAIDYTITLPNTTDDRWQKCCVRFAILYNGEYYDTESVYGNYIKTGEDAILTDYFFVLIEDKEAKDVIDQFTLVPTEVTYVIDTDF